MSWTTGLTIALTSPKITATTKMMPTRCAVESPPTNSTPATSLVTTHSARPVSPARSTNRITGRSCHACSIRPQQIDVHDPAVTFPRLGAHRGDAATDVTDGARHQDLLRRAQIGAPPNPRRGRALQEGLIAVEHHHRRATDPVLPQPASGGDEHRGADVVERNAVPGGQRLDGGDAGDDVVGEFDAIGDHVEDAQGAVVQRGITPRQECAHPVV